jgi:hypothetical protein
VHDRSALGPADVDDARPKRVMCINAAAKQGGDAQVE